MSETTFENILVRQAGRVGIVQINRPKALNALNTPTMLEIVAALQQLDADPGVGCMVLTGSEKAFAAGADIKQMAESTVADQLNMVFLDLWDRLQQITKPVIAAVSGWCLGGGSELAMACDMIVAAESARFGQPEINLGIIPGAGGTQRLTRAVGKTVAMEMVLNDRRLTAAEALQYGLVNRVVPTERYLEEAIQLATEIAERAPVAVRLGKEAVNKAFETTLTEGVYLERRLFTMLFGTEDQKEGMAAFIEKRPAKWQAK
ncbi:MAG TPA: enoyl-CoA hydratase-related protein [Anaerolineae bacterium]|nr:enoyl-CoA hydratase-related protein [Anaerolineae bacterium]HMR67473.1 enoyl-CoA hydratase-related protein [Anaerolineae bacterium]